MPAIQQGTLTPVGRNRWRARWYDERGDEKSKTLAMKERDARRWLDAKCDEIELRRRGDWTEPKPEAPGFDTLCDDFLAQHVADASTIKTLKERLKRPRDKFGSTRIDRLSISEMRKWFAQQSPGYAPLMLRAVRQVLNYAVEVQLIDSNPAKFVKTPAPRKAEVPVFDSFDDLRKVAEYLPVRSQAIPLFAAATGLRPEEWAALERTDIDREAGVIHIRRVVVDGVVKDTLKTDRSMRDVPLSDAALEALNSMMPRLDTPLVFPSKQGKHLNLDNWRRREWKPAVEAAGLDGRTPYSCRHSFISWLLAAGIPPLDVAKIAGTSMRMLDQTYGHLMPSAHDRVRLALDTLAAAEQTQIAAT